MHRIIYSGDQHVMSVRVVAARRSRRSGALRARASTGFTEVCCSKGGHHWQEHNSSLISCCIVSIIISLVFFFRSANIKDVTCFFVDYIRLFV